MKLVDTAHVQIEVTKHKPSILELILWAVTVAALTWAVTR